MSYYFDADTQNEAFYLDITEIDPTNITMSCLFNPDDADTFYAAMAVCDKDGDIDYHRLSLRGPFGGDPIDVVSSGATFQRASSSTSFVAGTWHHAFGDISGAQPRRIRLDGAGGATDANAVTIDNLDRISIGSQEDLTPSGHFQGYIGEVAVWLDSAAMFTDDEIETLATRHSPLFVKPQSLLFYAPLIGNAVDLISGTTLTAVGDPDVSPHPRMIYPSEIWVPYTEWAIASGMSKLIIPSYLKQGKHSRRNFLKNTILTSLGIK